MLIAKTVYYHKRLLDARTLQDIKLIREFYKDLRKPLGPIWKNVEECLDLIESAPRVITVGDISSLEVAKYRIPDIAVVDYQTNPLYKGNLEGIKSIGERIIKVNNPENWITKELWKAIDDALRINNKTRIEVDGEEDLAILVAISLASEGTLVAYGMPRKGIVTVEINLESKRTVTNLLAKFETE